MISMTEQTIDDLVRHLDEVTETLSAAEGQLEEKRIQVVDLERRLAATAEERDTWKDGGETLAMQVQDLQRDIDQWVKNSAVSQRRVQTLERQLADATAAARKPGDYYKSRWQRAEYQLAQMREALNGIIRFAELQASNKRGPCRTRGWFGAEKVGDEFGDIADRARTALQAGSHE